MTRFAISFGILVLATCAMSLAQPPSEPGEPALWLRYAAISPDGGTIVFSYRGDIYRVPSSGGHATPLTIHPAHETRPIWSPDGSMIAFASDRYGNPDIFVVPAAGGAARRLTYHSAVDEPASFAPDGQRVVFSSARLDDASCVQFPTPAQPELYEVSVNGGMPRRVLTTPARDAVWNRSESRLAYTDRKAYEMDWRKHDDSAFARDVWLYEPKAGRHTRLTEFGADDRQPVWNEDESALYYLSERSGSFNVWHLDLETLTARQLTSHTRHPVRFLSASENGDLCYTFDGELYLRPAGADESERLVVHVSTGRQENAVEWTDVSSEISEYAVSPDGKEIAFIARGEVFVTSVKYAETRRITDSPEQERSVSFSPDGRSLVYAGERDGSWNLYRSDLTDDDEPSFFNATAIRERVVLEHGEEAFQPRFSPDGKEIAFLENRSALKVLTLETGALREILPANHSYSYVDGDQSFEWSPDGRWFLVETLSDRRWSTEVALVDAAGGAEPVNLTRSGYWDAGPRWIRDGEGVLWFSDRHGARQHSGRSHEGDVYAAFLNREAWDRFRLTPAEFEQLAEREKKAKKEQKDDEKDGEDASAKKKRDGDEGEDDENGTPKLPEPIEIELEGLEDRMVRLTMQSAEIADARLTPDGETLLYLARFEKGFDLWKYERRKGEIKLLAKLGAKRAGSLHLDKEGKTAFVLADRRIRAVDVGSGKPSPVKLKARMRLDRAAEREYLFEHVWRQTREKFYVEDLHGVDWEFYKAAYARFLPHIDNNTDFAEMISELQGELNASHTGGRHRPTRADGAATASLAFFPDPAHDGPGIRIEEIIEGSPLSAADSKVRAGVVIESIDAHAVGAGENWYPLLNHKAGEPVRLGLLDPDSGERWEETTKPISAGKLRGLLYQRWVRSRRAEVERLSGGRLGYAHIRGMSDGPYREVFEEVFGKSLDKEGLVLDTRFNGGGNLVEALTVFLTGEQYFRMVPRGQLVGINPEDRWTKPSIVVMNEGNYSDAHCFPAAYTSLGVGETVGMQVTGTCTAVWWERLQDRSLIFGIPQVAQIDNEGDITENKHLDPDHPVDNDPALEAEGRDQQLEKAVEVLLTTIDAGA